MAKNLDSPKKPKDPARPTRSTANREQLPPLAPALADLLNPAIKRGEAGVGSQTGLQPPPDNSRERRADAAAAHRARASTPQGLGEAGQTGYVAKTPVEPVIFDAELARAFGMPADAASEDESAGEPTPSPRRKRPIDEAAEGAVAATTNALEE